LDFPPDFFDFGAVGFMAGTGHPSGVGGGWASLPAPVNPGIIRADEFKAEK